MLKILSVSLCLITIVYAGEPVKPKPLGAAEAKEEFGAVISKTPEDFWGAPSPHWQNDEHSKFKPVSPKKIFERSSPTLSPLPSDLVAYKAALQPELNELKKALWSEDYYFDDRAASSPVSPRARIRRFTDIVRQAHYVEEALDENKIDAQDAHKWPGENLRIIGSTITSMHECHDLVIQLGDNSFVRSAIGGVALGLLVSGVYRYCQK